jgi:hypothetical protein
MEKDGFVYVPEQSVIVPGIRLCYDIGVIYHHGGHMSWGLGIGIAILIIFTLNLLVLIVYVGPILRELRLTIANLRKVTDTATGRVQKIDEFLDQVAGSLAMLKTIATFGNKLKRKKKKQEEEEID